jgi:hypothetical protein
VPDRTPGERVYAAYVRVRYGLPAAEAAASYAGSIPQERDAWEAAAQAVLAQCEQPRRKETPSDTPPKH